MFPSFAFCYAGYAAPGGAADELEAYAAADKIKSGKKKNEVLESYAEKFVYGENYTAAENIYAFLISQNPSKKKTFFYNIKLGDICELKSDYGMSLDYYRRAEALYKKNIEVKFKIGDILLKSNLYTLAEKTFLNALALDKSSNYAKKRLGDIYFVQNLYSKALEYYDKIDPYYYTPEIISNMSECCRAFNKIDKAIKITEEFLLSNESSDVFLILAVMYADKKMYKEAEDRLLKSVELDASNFYAYLYLGRIYLILGDFNKAEANLEKAGKINSSYSAVDLILSKISYKKGNFYEAKRRAHNALVKAKTSFTKTQAQKTVDFLNKNAK
jgi:tetratricopeptide (TPR) repeat protein